MAVAVYFNGEDLGYLVALLTQVANDTNLNQTTRRTAQSYLDNGLSSWQSAPTVLGDADPTNDWRAIHDPDVRRVVINTRDTLINFRTFLSSTHFQEPPEIGERYPGCLLDHVAGWEQL